MNTLRRPPRSVVIGSCLLFCVAIALGWAWRRHRAARTPATEVRVLCAEEWIDADLVHEFARDHDVRVQLYTYRDVAEMLRPLANSDGRADVVCTSSLLLQSLERSHWIRRGDFVALAQAQGLAADFLHLPFDPTLAYGVPVHWTAFGYYSTRVKAEGSLKSLQARGRVGVWASDLNLMALLTEAGVDFAERLESEGVKRLEDDVQRFVTSVGLILPDLTKAQPADWAKRFDFAHVPSVTLDGGGQFAPGDGGGVVDVGLLAVGERAPAPELALELIKRLSAPEPAMAAAARVGLGTVHVAGETDARFTTARRASALRGFELTKLRFPDVNAEATLKFARTFAQARAASARR